MKGGFLVAPDSDLYRRVADALVGWGATSAPNPVGGDMLQLVDAEGRIFTMYEHTYPGMDWEYQEGPFFAAPGVRVPEMTTMTAAPFDCRWEDLVARVAALAASTSPGPTWLLDGDGVVWDAVAVDPAKVRL